jgi:predicted metal-dependent hydrolase
VKKQQNMVIFQGETQLDDCLVSYTVKRSSRAKRVRLSVSLQKELQIIIPEGHNIGRIEDLLEENKEWILDKLQEIGKRENTPKPLQQKGIPVLRYLGKKYHIVTILDARSPIRVVLQGEKAYITMPENNEILLRQVSESWYRWAAKELFTERVQILAEQMGVKYQKIFIKNQKTRWGSCSSKGNLNFNMRLVMAPPEIVDYIIIHELAHLVEMNHSKSFWQLVEHHCPDYKKYLAWLKEHGTNLQF